MKGSSINRPQVPLLSPIECDIEDDRQNNASSGEGGFNPLYDKNSEDMLQRQKQDVLSSSKIFIPLSTPRCSLGSSASTDHLGFESQLLEVAIRTNDVSKVKHFLMIHRDKFQINSKPPEKNFNFNLQNQDININLQPNNIQSVRSDQNDSSRSSLSLDDQTLLPFKNALHTAIDYGSLDVVRTLLENGIDPNAGGHVLTDLDVPRHSPSGSSGPSERCNVKPASIQCEIDEDTGFDIHDIYHYDTEIRSVVDDVRPDEDVAIAVRPTTSVASSPSPNPVTSSVLSPSPKPAAAMVVAVSERNANRSVLMRQRSLSLDNDKPTKKNRPLLQKLRAGCSKLVRSTPSDMCEQPQQARPATSHAAGITSIACVAGGCAAAGLAPKGPTGMTGFAAAAPVEFKGIMSELRRSSDVVRAILWNLSFRDTYSSGNVSDMDSSTELDVDMLFDRHEQRRYADYELENGCRLLLLDSLSSLQSFQSLSSTGSPTVPAVMSGGSVASVPMAADCPATVPVVIFDHAPAAVCQVKPLQSSRPSPQSQPLILPSTTPPPLTSSPPIILPDTVSQPSADTDDVVTVVPKIIFKIKSSLSLDRMNEMADMYTKQYLMTLPPLFLAVVRQNSTMIYLLLKFGGSPNVQDIYGNTPLHLAIVQPEISWNCVLDLLEFGAKICIKNATDICPSDIVDSLLRIQVHMINDCWKILSGSTAVIKERMWHHNFINYDQVGKPSDLPTLPSRLFRRMKFTQTDSAEERHSSNLDDFFGSIWSLKSKISNKTLETDEVRNHALSQSIKTKNDKKTIINDYGIKHKNSKALKLYNIERKFQVISHLSGNVECLGFILNGLNNYIVHILKYLEANHDLSLRHICTLLKTILNVAVMEFGEQGKKEELSVILCSVMKVCLSALQGIHHVQFTAMAIINRVIDISVQYNVSFIKAAESDYLHHPHYVSEMNKYKSSKDDSSIGDDRTKPGGPNKKFTSMWRYFIGDQAFNNKTGNSKTNKNTSESVIGILSNVHVLSIINVLHNSLTLYKRVIGSKRLCPPSHRSSQCSYHCLQILSARTLLFMSLNDDVKSELVKEPQLKILAASLESTNDPVSTLNTAQCCNIM
uniref:Uncharacterized protein n=1 Tax=Schizaphis graminum TaxID=13262 RepID=A0A2S2NSK1_SCHGA